MNLVGIKMIGKSGLVGAALLVHTAFAPQTFDTPSMLQRHTNLVWNIVVIGADNRQALDPADARAHFSATGEIHCGPGGVATVQLVRSAQGALKVISSAHQFYDRACKYLGPSPCRVEFPHSTPPSKFRVKTLSLNVGGCSIAPDNIPNKNLDWSVFELDGAPTGIQPYDVPEEGETLAREGAEVLTVSSPSDFKVNGKTSYHYQVCKIRDRYYFTNYPLQTDCDTGRGASGAGQLVDKSGHLAVVAVHVAGTDLPSGWNPNYPKPEYDRDTYFNASVPVEGDFLKVINGKLQRPPPGGR